MDIAQVNSSKYGYSVSSYSITFNVLFESEKS